MNEISESSDVEVSDLRLEIEQDIIENDTRSSLGRLYMKCLCSICMPDNYALSCIRIIANLLKTYVVLRFLTLIAVAVTLLFKSEEFQELQKIDINLSSLEK